MNKKVYNELIAFHPGYYINDIIEDMEITQEAFAKRCELTAKHLSDIVNGKAKVTIEVARKLSLMLGTSSEMWLNLQAKYDAKIAEIDNCKKVDEQIEILKMMDYNYFVKNNLLIRAKKAEEKVVQLCQYLKISSLKVLTQPDFSANFRSSSNSQTNKNVINNNTWLETAIKIGMEQDVSEYNSSKLKDYLPEIRKMTTQLPQQFVPRIKEIFSECGVIFVLLPKMKNANINGVVKWITHNKVLVAMNDRYSYADTFWFSLMHEIKHVFQRKTNQVILSCKDNLNEYNKQLEDEADEFARDFLISFDDYDSFTSIGSFSKPSVVGFAKSVGIHPGIVVGRLQNDGFINHSFLNDLREKYKINITK